MVRSVKGLGGSFSDLTGCPIVESTWEQLTVINFALNVLSWYENLPKDEQPPRWIWWSEELLDQWFEDVRENRGGGGKKSVSRSKYDSAEDMPMMRSSLADEFRPKIVRN